MTPVRLRSLATAVLLGGLASGVACAAEAPEPPPGHGLEALAWLAGSWRGEQDGTRMEEFWTPPGGGMMLGLHRDVSPSGGAFFEYLRIEERDGRVYYLASPMGRSPATPFRLAELREGRAVFENPEHDYPQRIIYIRDGADGLRARIEGEESGHTRSSEWRYRRVP